MYFWLFDEIVRTRERRREEQTLRTLELVEEQKENKDEDLFSRPSRHPIRCPLLPCQVQHRDLWVRNPETGIFLSVRLTENINHEQVTINSTGERLFFLLPTFSQVPLNFNLGAA